MHCRKSCLVAAVCTGVLLALMGGVAWTAPVEAKGTIESVTLYRGEALVTRGVSAEAPAGDVVIVVTDLPERIRSESLYAEGDDGTRVRAVRFRTRATGEAPREDIRKLDAQIEDIGKQLRANADAQGRVARKQKQLEGLQSFIAPTARGDMAKGVLNEQALRGVTTFAFEQIDALGKEAFTLKEDSAALQKQLAVLQRTRRALTTSHSKLAREAVVFLQKRGGGALRVKLSYLVTNASWSPAYNLRAGGDLKHVQVEYNAIIQQMTGEDWTNASITLSTASPAMVSEPPLLAPFAVTTGTGVPTGRGARQEIGMLNQRMRELDKSRASSGSRESSTATTWAMNSTATTGQAYELSASSELARALRDGLRRQGSGLSVNYRLEGKVSLASRDDQQMARIADLTLPATFANLAVPLLTERVYRSAEVTNNSAVGLLEGSCSAYFNGDYVGKGTLPAVAPGQRFRTGFGSDPQLRAWREFISREETVQGGNKEVTFSYRLVLDNYKDEAVTVRALDRVPWSTGDVRVTLGELKDPLSTDGEYLRVFKPNGILRWEVEVPKKSAAATARIINYSYKLEFDRNRTVVPVTSGEAEAKAMEQLDMLMKSF